MPASKVDETEAIPSEELVSAVDGVVACIERTRNYSVANTLLAVAFVVASYNSYLSWDRGFVTDPERTPCAPSERLTDGTCPDDGKLSQKTLSTRRLRDAMKQKWLDSQYFQLPGLAVQIGANSVAPFSTLALLPLSAWIAFLARRENRAVVRLSRRCIRDGKAKRLSKQRLAYVHARLANAMVLASLRGDDGALGIRASRHALPIAQTPSLGVRFRRSLRELSATLVAFVSACAAAAALGMEAYSFSLVSPLRFEGLPMHEVIRRLETSGEFIDWPYGLALVALAGLVYLGLQHHGFDRATRQALRDLRSQVESPKRREELPVKVEGGLASGWRAAVLLSLGLDAWLILSIALTLRPAELGGWRMSLLLALIALALQILLRRALLGWRFWPTLRLLFLGVPAPEDGDTFKSATNAADLMRHCSARQDATALRSGAEQFPDGVLMMLADNESLDDLRARQKLGVGLVGAIAGVIGALAVGVHVPHLGPAIAGVACILALVLACLAGLLFEDDPVVIAVERQRLDRVWAPKAATVAPRTTAGLPPASK